MPEYPTLGNEDSHLAQYIIPAVSMSFSTVVYALLALLITAVFVLDISNGSADGKMLLLCLYFVLLFLNEEGDSYAGYYSKLANCRIFRGQFWLRCG